MTEHSSKKRKTNNKAAAPTKAAPAPPKPVRIRQPSSNRKRTPVAAPDALPTCNENASSFGDLGLPDGIQRSVANLGLSSFSAVQKAVIAPFYNNKDVVATLSNGADSILSFLVPSLGRLEAENFRSRHGTGVLVVVPTREAAVQVSETATELIAGAELELAAGQVMEGSNRGSEEKKLEHGLAVLVGTPARLLDHLRNTSPFVIENIKSVVVYEADKYEELGLSKDLRDILTFLPKKRMSAVFGSQKNDALEAVAELLCGAERIQYHENAAPVATPVAGEKREQAYVIVAPEDRLILLATFVKRFQTKKIVVRCASTQGVVYYSEVLSLLDIPCHSLHSKQSKKDRADELAEYLTDGHGILLCSEQAAQGTEIPAADWVIQFDPPRSVSDFITPSKPIGGRSVIFLQPNERAFIDKLTSAGFTTEEFAFPRKHLLKVQPIIEKAVSKIYTLHNGAKDAFRSYIQDYNVHPNRDIFDAEKLDLTKLCKCFGYEIPPRVNVREEKEEKFDSVARPYGPSSGNDGKKRRWA